MFGKRAILCRRYKLFIGHEHTLISSCVVDWRWVSVAYECAGYGRASVPPVPAAVGQRLPAPASWLDVGRRGRQPLGAAALCQRALPLSVHWGAIAQQRAQGPTRLLPALQRLAQAPRDRLMVPPRHLWQVYLILWRPATACDITVTRWQIGQS